MGVHKAPVGAAHGADGGAGQAISAPVRVVVVDDAPRTVDNLTRLLGFESDIEVVGSALNAASGIDEVRRLQPDVLVMDVNLPDLDGIRATEQLSAELPLVGVILISVQEDREYLRRAMQAGARRYLVKPFSADELVTAVRQVHLHESLKRQRAAPGPAPAAAPEIPATAPEPPAPEDDSAAGAGAGLVFAVFSGKGGVGKSTIACNLACEMARPGGLTAVLVDLDLQFGDVAVMMGIDAPGTMADVVRLYPNLDGPAMGALLGESGGVRILAAPFNPELADLIRAEHVEAALAVLRQAFDVVVIDVAQHLDDVSLDVLERADKVVLVTDLNVPAIKDAKLAFRLFEHLGISRDRVVLVLNRVDAPSDITIQQLEANLKHPISARIPSLGKQVIRSVQRGVPLTVSDPDGEFAARIRDLAATLLPLPGPSAGQPGAQRRRRFWGRPGREI